ncbi:MAG: DUF1634 domain-containing protein [Tepidisphaeraceae bacterium]
MTSIQEPPPAFEQVHDERVVKVEIAISNLLRIGVAVSLLFIVIGTVLMFLHHPEYRHSGRTLQHLIGPSKETADATPFRTMIQGIRHAEGRSVITLGLMLLIATPVVRVAVSVLAFVYQGDRVFVGITTLVFCLLLVSFFLGKAEG